MLLTPTETKALLAELGHRPDKRLGQSFLIDGNLVRKSLEMAALPASSQVVEVGPGLGSLTGALLDAGHQVYAVERDAALANHLRASKAEALESGQLVLREGDAMDLPLAWLPGGDGECYVVANLPYSVASRLMVEIAEGSYRPDRMCLTIQKEVADRLTAKPNCRFTLRLN